MKKISLLLVSFCLSTSALADKSMDADIKEMTTDMVALYKQGKVAALTSADKDCWSSIKKGEADIEGSVAGCAVVTLMGFTIESLVADSKNRKPNAYWTEDQMAIRIMNNVQRLGISEKKFENEIQPAIDMMTESMGEELAKALVKAKVL